mgnify:CR=1 FL=1
MMNKSKKFLRKKFKIEKNEKKKFRVCLQRGRAPPPELTVAVSDCCPARRARGRPATLSSPHTSAASLKVYASPYHIYTSARKRATYSKRTNTQKNKSSRKRFSLGKDTGKRL